TPSGAASKKTLEVTPARQPLPLSATQEGQVREIYYKRVRTKCADEVRDFAACASNRTFSAPFVCRAQRRAMNTCMLQYANQAEQDAARDEWFATRDERRREREAKEEKRKEQEKFHREWW
ncbi:cytochrome c oxidase biogenesis protein Cmc1 like-domain-containing protein, partial [Delphinella strobiligena]